MEDDTQIRNRALLRPEHKDEARAQIQRDTARFLLAGGSIQELPGWKDGRKVKDLSEADKERIRAEANPKESRRKIEVQLDYEVRHGL